MAEPLKIRFATDVEGAKQGMANLAASVASNALSMASTLKAANDNVGRLRAAMNGLSTVRSAFLGLAGLAVGVAAGMALVSSAVSQANAQLDRFIKLGENAERAGVGVEFFQRFSEAAEKAKIDVSEVEAALKRAGQTVMPKFEQEDPIRKRLNELFESGYTGSFQSKGLASYNSANSNEERIRAAVTAMQELRDLGLQVAAIDLAEKLFGADTADRIRSGRLEIEAIATALDRKRDDLITQQEVQQAAEFRERLAEAYKTIDDFLHVSVALEGSGRALQEVWLTIAEAVAKATVNAGNFYTKIQEMQGPLGDYLKTVGLIVSGTAKIFAEGFNDQNDGSRKLYDKPIGPEQPGAPPNALTGAPQPPRRPLDFYTNPEKYNAKPTGGGGAAKTATESLNQVQTFINGLERSTAALKAEVDAQGKDNEEKAKTIALAKAQEIAKQNNITLSQADIARINETAAATARYKDTLNDLVDRQSAIRSAGGDLFRGIYSDARNGAGAVDILNNALGRLADRIANNQLDALADTLFGKSGSGQSGQIGSLFTSLFRANGGDVRAGQPTTVGEYGREVFVPDSNGRVYPVGQGSAGFGGSPTFKQETHYHDYAGVGVQEKTTGTTPNRRTDVLIGEMVATGLKSPQAQRAGQARRVIST